MSKNFDLWPDDNRGPYIRYEPDTVLPPDRPPNPFDTIAPRDLFAAGVVPECFLAWQSDKTRDLVRWVITNHGHTLAEALDELYELGGL